jgi:hypothetical protein
MTVPKTTEFYDNDEFERKPAENTADGDFSAGFTGGYLLANTFRLEKRIGKGGMGEAWKAHDEVADRDVVIKLIPKEIQHIKEAVDNVKTSFKKVHALQHQHICPVYGIFNDPVHGLYLVMKYIDGVSLDVYKRRVMNIPEYVNAALLKALSKKREERFENCKAFVRAMATKPKPKPEKVDEEDLAPDDSVDAAAGAEVRPLTEQQSVVKRIRRKKAGQVPPLT